MDSLREHGFYGGGLVDVNNQVLVERYNKCLAELGLTKTNLTGFQIDGRGWSPQIAEEKEDPNYLSHDGAVQFAIVLTPEQGGKPVFNPTYSFERAVLANVLTGSEGAITRVTRDAGMIIQIDPGVSELKKLADLATVKSVRVNLSDTLGMIEEASAQRALVKRFVGEAGDWSNPNLRQQLLESGKKFGDLRFNPKLEVSREFTELAAYYTVAFGGVFVFRHGSQNMLLVTNEAEKKRKVAGGKVLSRNDKTLFAQMVDLGLVEIPLDWYRQNLWVLEEMREAILVATLYSGQNAEIDFSKLNGAQQKGLVMEFRHHLPPEYSTLERLEKKLANGEEINLERLSLRMRWLLGRPKSSLAVTQAEVVWKLICRVAPTLVTNWHAYDKETFFASYGVWPDAQKTWTVRKLLTGGLKPRRHV